ncbi:MAG: TRAP transporter small permease subunit [Xanthomonadaceae bacterium]|nr:TRAP transporter small permease subunit [Xanthomonadaceae bacterium]MDE2083625.1 TRAP transporter small permease subunit [Xanthomonadaceae bacterium]MDE2257211.1 TRAP transporter small permease subunit [Xanthomonadaceae bacterium]
MTLQRALEILRRIEDWLLAVLVLLLVVLAGSQIILRDFFATGISWADPLMRQLVLWTGMLGALAAVRDDKHIALDVLQRFLSPLAQTIARIVTFGFAAAICAALAWYSYVMLNVDYTSATPSSAFDSLPAWIPETILPAAFGLMAIRFVLRAFAPPAHTPPLLHSVGPAP